MTARGDDNEATAWATVGDPQQRLKMEPPCDPVIPLRRIRKWKVKVSQSCLTLCDPMDCIVHGILQARILQWVVFPFSRGSSQPRDGTQVSCIARGFFTS